VGKLTRLTHKIAIQLHLVAERCTISSSRSRRPVLKLLDTPSYEVAQWKPSLEIYNIMKSSGLGMLAIVTYLAFS
jgi:hypothetical protein